MVLPKDLMTIIFNIYTSLVLPAVLILHPTSSASSEIKRTSFFPLSSIFLESQANAGQNTIFFRHIRNTVSHSRIRSIASLVSVWNSLPETVDFRSFAGFIRKVTVVDLTDYLRCFSNMFYSLLGQMLEHFVPFCPVRLDCILSFN